VSSALIWALRTLRDEREVLRSFVCAAYFLEKVGSDADHLHAHFATAPAATALMMSRMSGLPFSFTGHAYDVVAAQRPRQLDRKVEAAAFVVTTTSHMRDFIRTHVSRDGYEAVTTIPSGIDLSFFGPRPGDPGGSRIVTIARLVEKKGIGDLLEACALLVEDDDDLRCDVAGVGPLLEGLIEHRDRLGLQDHVEFHGPVSREEVRTLLSRSSVFALPCLVGTTGDRDGFPIAILEAMAIGVPVVTTPVGGIPEGIVDGESGLFVPPRDPSALAAALRRLLADPSLRSALAQRARASAEQRDIGTQVALLRARFVTTVRAR
jgi:glycosyltransferase involved in cell wall biosynthesis